MQRAQPVAAATRTTCLFLFFVLCLLAVISTAHEQDGQDSRPCVPQDKCFVDIHSDNSPRCWIQDHNQNIRYLKPLDGGHHNIPNACWRSNIFDGDGYLVAYPSAGGIIIMETPSAVDLQHLGLPNTHDTPRSPDQNENLLATRMVQLGAQWWPNWDLYLRHSNRIRDQVGIFYDYHFPSQVTVSFPTTGGAWVANFTRDAARHSYEDKDCQSWLPPPSDLWRIKMQYALTMDDKAEMMKEMGATFYNSIEEVPGLAKNVDEAVSLFEPFRERLRNMDDDSYRRQFCSDEGKDMMNESVGKSRWGIGWFFDELR